MKAMTTHQMMIIIHLHLADSSSNYSDIDEALPSLHDKQFLSSLKTDAICVLEFDFNDGEDNITDGLYITEKVTWDKYLPD